MYEKEKIGYQYQIIFDSYFRRGLLPHALHLQRFVYKISRMVGQNSLTLNGEVLLYGWPCLAGLDSTKQVNMLSIQWRLSNWIQQIKLEVRHLMMVTLTKWVFTLVRTISTHCGKISNWKLFETFFVSLLTTISCFNFIFGSDFDFEKVKKKLLWQNFGSAKKHKSFRTKKE